MGAANGDHCQFYLKNKKRYCRFPLVPGETLCYTHITERQDKFEDIQRVRIPCPIDPKHSVYQDQLHRHLPKCSKEKLRYEMEEQPCYVKGINIPRSDIPENDQSTLPDDIRLDTWIPLVERVFEKALEITGFSKENVLGDNFEEKEQGPWVDEMITKACNHVDAKHAPQYARLVEVMEEAGHLEGKALMVEYGCGKGGMTRWLSVAHDVLEKDWDFVLVEREGRRNKQERRKDMKQDGYLRLKLDLADFDLCQLLSRQTQCKEGITDDIKGWFNTIQSNPTQHRWDKVVIHAKHLCGGATDLAIHSAVSALHQVKATGSRSTVENEKIGDRHIPKICIATCCHHMCCPKTYVNVKYLDDLLRTIPCDKPLDTSFFLRLLARMSGWASMDNTKQEQHPERYRTGRYAKRILDLGRWSYLKEHGFHEPQFRPYIDNTITPENMILLTI